MGGCCCLSLNLFLCSEERRSSGVVVGWILTALLLLLFSVQAAAALGLAADEVAKLRDVVQSGGFKVEKEVEAGSKNDLSYFG